MVLILWVSWVCVCAWGGRGRDPCFSLHHHPLQIPSWKGLVQHITSIITLVPVPWNGELRGLKTAELRNTCVVSLNTGTSTRLAPWDLRPAYIVTSNAIWRIFQKHDWSVPYVWTDWTATSVHLCREPANCFYFFIYSYFITIMALQPFVGPWPLFQFLHLYTVGTTPWTGDQPVVRPLPTHGTIQTQNKRNNKKSMPWVGIESTKLSCLANS
jgi:hypothetical protein